MEKFGKESIDRMPKKIAEILANRHHHSDRKESYIDYER